VCRGIDGSTGSRRGLSLLRVRVNGSSAYRNRHFHSTHRPAGRLKGSNGRRAWSLTYEVTSIFRKRVNNMEFLPQLVKIAAILIVLISILLLIVKSVGELGLYS